MHKQSETSTKCNKVDYYGAINFPDKQNSASSHTTSLAMSQWQQYRTAAIKPKPVLTNWGESTPAPEKMLKQNYSNTNIDSKNQLKN